jgi:hypothetical protein
MVAQRSRNKTKKTLTLLKETQAATPRVRQDNSKARKVEFMVFHSWSKFQKRL